jgi:hypothetical protein
VIKNWDLYKSHVETHSINTRHGTDLHPSTSKLIKFQKEAFYFGIKVVNHLPSSTENLSPEEKQFRLTLKKFLFSNSLYTWDEYLNSKPSKDLGFL